MPRIKTLNCCFEKTVETTFKILDKKKWDARQNLIIELGWEGISYLWYEKNNMQVNSLIQYQFKRNRTGEQLSELLGTLFDKENEYFENIEEADIFFNFSESELVPQAFVNDELINNLLGYKHGKESEAKGFEEPVPSIDAVNLYRVHEDILDTIKTFFPAARLHHSTTANIDLCVGTDGNALYCLIYNNSFKVLFYKGGQLHLVQYFQYNAPYDVAYHLINICKQHDTDIASTTLYLGGLVDDRSMLYQSITKFFGNCKLLQPKPGILFSEYMQDQPLHFFAHLTSLSQCVSSAETLEEEK